MGLLLYTDGVYEGFAEDGTRLGDERFIERATLLRTITDPADYLTALLGDVQRSDDTALLYLAWP